MKNHFMVNNMTTLSTDQVLAENSQKAIGLFDSGVGGLTVLNALRKKLPQENYIYLGDTARLPYGTKSPETITRYALQASSTLVERNIKLLVIACNTATSTALPALQAAYPHIPVIGVVRPGAEAACKASKNGNIAVIATASTIKGEAYVKAIHAINPNANVHSIACPLFVPLAEDGLTTGPIVESIAARYLEKTFSNANSENPDCLVLGCTHFPLLAEAIQNVVGSHVKLVDSAQTTAQRVEDVLKENNLFNTQNKARTLFLTTDDKEQFAKVGEDFLKTPISPENLELVDL